MSSVANALTQVSATLFVSIGCGVLGKFSLTLVWVMAMSGVYKHYIVFTAYFTIYLLLIYDRE